MILVPYIVVCKTALERSHGCTDLHRPLLVVSSPEPLGSQGELIV